MAKKYYVVDINGTGYADIVTELPEDYCRFICETYDKETAVNEATRYEQKMQEEVDKATGNYDYDDYDDCE